MTHEMGISVTKNDNFSEWYTQVITKGKFITYYDISGCYVLLPNSYGIWENIQSYIDKNLKNMDIKNSYFPMFITEKNLTREKDHIEGFAPEVAWVTHSGNSKLEEKIAVRPTSECAMYPIFSDLIHSYDDLPLKFNQWCSVVRWEFKDCTPFIRSREFLWSETHGCYSLEENAVNDALEILNLYEKTYNNLLAIPVIKGTKTENEKFAGAHSTYTLEAFIPTSGKAIQSCTAHNLGQNFSNMFNISFQDIDKEKKYAWQNSCGFTTRSIGIMLMNHGDDKGAIIPPYVAPIQIVIIPIPIKKRIDDVINKCTELFNILKTKYRVTLDQSQHTPGWKFNCWETQGVPLRIEIGPKDIDNNTVTLCKRTDFKKYCHINNNTLFDIIDATLKNIHDELYNTASNNLMTNIIACSDINQFGAALDNKQLCYINWCNSNSCEDHIKEHYKAKSLCIPMDLTINLTINLADNNCCICNNKSEMKVLFGKSY